MSFVLFLFLLSNVFGLLPLPSVAEGTWFFK